MSTTDSGRKAEKAFADYLEKDGHKILDLNWRRRRCEIDVVSRKKKTIYFTEVKFRGSNEWGSGFDYITPKKLKQMKFAAEMWAAENKWSGEMMLLATEVDGANGVNIVEIDQS